MRRDERIAKIRAALARAMTIARRKGLRIVSDGGYEVDGDGRVIGVSVVHALDYARRVKVPFSNRMLESEIEAVELGFDAGEWPARNAEFPPLDRDLYDVGLSLRKEFEPVRCGS